VGWRTGGEGEIDRQDTRGVRGGKETGEGTRDRGEGTGGGETSEKTGGGEGGGGEGSGGMGGEGTGEREI